MTHDDLLVQYMNEHYNHARTHESLRGQITSILCGAALAIIGFGLGKDASGIGMVGLGLGAFCLGLLNYRVNKLHNNRFDAHAATAGFVRNKLEERLLQNESQTTITTRQARKKFDEVKRGSLSRTWNYVSLVICIAALLLVAYGVVYAFGIVPTLRCT